MVQKVPRRLAIDPGLCHPRLKADPGFCHPRLKSDPRLCHRSNGNSLWQPNREWVSVLNQKG